MTEGAHDAHCVRAGVRCSDFCFGRSIAVDVRCEFVLETTIGSVCDAKTEIRTPDPSADQHEIAKRVVRRDRGLPRSDKRCRPRFDCLET